MENANINTAKCDSLDNRMYNLEHNLVNGIMSLQQQMQDSMEYMKAMYAAIQNGEMIGNPIPCNTGNTVNKEDVEQDKTPTSVSASLKSPVKPPFAESPPESPEKGKGKPYVARYSFIMKNFPKEMTLVDYFVRFFNENCWEAYQREIVSEEWRSMEKKERERVVGKWQRHKDTVGFLVRFCDRCPEEKPTGCPTSYQKWRHELYSIAERAVVEVRNLLEKEGELQPNEKLSQSKLQKSASYREAKKNLNPDVFPSNTPEELRMLFLPSNSGGRKRKDMSVVGDEEAMVDQE
jgi:hypothetical protein